MGPKVKFYLAHMETGQRYPLTTEEVVIGRSSGDLLFADDTKLSSQHCRIVMTEAGLGIHDMNSANGTYIDGKRLASQTVFSFKTGSRLKVGDQEFTLFEAGQARKERAAKRASRKKESFLSRATPFVLGAAVLGSAAKLMDLRREQDASREVASIESPMEMVDREVQGVLNAYRKLGEDSQAGRTTEKEMAVKIRKELLPAAGLVQAKLGALKPQTEFEKKKLANTVQLIGALIGQVTAMADMAESQNPYAAARLKKFSEQLAVLSEQARAFKRQPAQN